LDTIKVKKADLVVVGSRGHSTMKRLMLGSLSTFLAQSSPVPVVIARTVEN
jgi:nucleotide-binding universal stress UspA family protein